MSINTLESQEEEKIVRKTVTSVEVIRGRKVNAKKREGDGSPSSLKLGVSLS